MRFLETPMKDKTLMGLRNIPKRIGSAPMVNGDSQEKADKTPGARAHVECH